VQPYLAVLMLRLDGRNNTMMMEIRIGGTKQQVSHRIKTLMVAVLLLRKMIKKDMVDMMIVVDMQKVTMRVMGTK
jgi:hypothetical protein